MLYKYEIAPTQAVYYDKNLYPMLDGMFLYGSYNRGEIIGIKLDSDNKHVMEALEIQLPQNVFLDPIVSIAVSANGEIYLGGHHVYKLTSVSMPQTHP